MRLPRPRPTLRAIPRYFSLQNDPGVEGFFVLAGATLVGSVTCAVTGVIVGLRREARKAPGRAGSSDS